MFKKKPKEEIIIVPLISFPVQCLTFELGLNDVKILDPYGQMRNYKFNLENIKINDGNFLKNLAIQLQRFEKKLFSNKFQIININLNNEYYQFSIDEQESLRATFPDIDFSY